MKRALILVFVILFSLCSCSTSKNAKKKKTRKRRGNYQLEKAYKHRRDTPLQQKYPDYQPFREAGKTTRNPHLRRILRTNKTKKIVMIADFFDKTDKFYEKLDQKASAMLSDKLKESEHIVLEDSTNLRKVINDSKAGNNSKDDIALAKLLGKTMNLSSFITGVIQNVDIHSVGNNIGLFKETKYACRLTMDLRVIDMNTLKIIFEETVQGQSEKSISHFFSVDQKSEYSYSVIEDALKNALEKVTWKIIPKIEKIGWRGRIAKVDQNKIYINGGLKTGLSIGTILLVSNIGEIILNPETGKPIGRAPGNIKGTIRIVDFFGEDGAIAVINSGAGFRVNDLIEIQ